MTQFKYLKKNIRIFLKNFERLIISFFEETFDK